MIKCGDDIAIITFLTWNFTDWFVTYNNMYRLEMYKYTEASTTMNDVNSD